ncbi:unnamed protein product [Parajaminaea phylloscopi]
MLHLFRSLRTSVSKLYKRQGAAILRVCTDWPTMSEQPSNPPQTSTSAANGSGKAKNKPKSQSAALDPAVIEAKRKARAEKKEREAREKAEKEAQAEASGLSAPLVDAQGIPLYKPRQWGLVEGKTSTPSAGKRRLKVLSWNMLAQGLVRRKLFPGSDALRWKDREAGLQAELIGHNWDVGCFQEVDRIDCHAKTLEKAGYSHYYSKGYSAKQHGLMLAWRARPRQAATSNSHLFEEKPVASETFFFDTAEVSSGRTGCSRVTRNIAVFAAIKYKDHDAQKGSAGVILATTHLFWHPMHAYERVRQVGLLVKALHRFQHQPGAVWAGWPTILAGDFNDQPHSASYGLLTGRDLDAHGREEIAKSRVVHQSVDDHANRQESDQANAVGGGSQPTEEADMGTSTPSGEEEVNDEEDGDDEDEDEDGEGEGDEEEGADDQMLKNCREARESDGLLTDEELVKLCDMYDPLGKGKGAEASPGQASLVSAYGAKYARLQDPVEDDNLFSSPSRGRERWDDPDWTEGDPNVHRHLAGTTAGNEPMWTLYSSLFGLTLDFIFLLPIASQSQEGMITYPEVTRLLRTHRTKDVEAGLPRKGICVSDHVAIGAELEI